MAITSIIKSVQQVIIVGNAHLQCESGEKKRKKLPYSPPAPDRAIGPWGKSRQHTQMVNSQSGVFSWTWPR